MSASQAAPAPASAEGDSSSVPPASAPPPTTGATSTTGGAASSSQVTASTSNTTASSNSTPAGRAATSGATGAANSNGQSQQQPVDAVAQNQQPQMQQQQQQQPVNFNPNYPPSRRVTIGGMGQQQQQGGLQGNNGMPQGANNNNNGMMMQMPPGVTKNLPNMGQQQQHQQQQQQGAGVPTMNNNSGGGMSLPPGLGTDNLNRRGSMSSGFGGGMDEFFTRRPSLGGFDMGMGDFFGNGRRDSMDSTTAALDAAIMDLSRRRYSAAMGTGDMTSLGGGLGGGMSSIPPPPPPPQGGMSNTNNNTNNSYGSPSLMTSPPGSQGSGSHQTHESINQRQQQLQQQQRELENRQKELEFQRQQLISSMQERSYSHHPNNAGVGGGMNVGGPGGLMPPMSSQQHAGPHNHHQHHRGSFGGMGGGGSLGLGSVGSHGSNSLGHSQPGTSSSINSNNGNPNNSMAPHRSSAASGGSGQHWWICQVCNSKAFASHEEARAHESICTEGANHNNGLGANNNNRNGSMTGVGGGSMNNKMQDNTNSMNPLPYAQEMSGGPGMGGVMARNYSMGLGVGGMDASGRGMSMSMMGGPGSVVGLGMDNSTRGVVSMGMDSSRGGGTSMGLDSSRNMSLGNDSSNSGHYSFHNERTFSMGPFAMLNQPMPLAMNSDKDWLTPLHCFVRRHCVEVFTATEGDVATPSKGKRKPIQVGQIGIRCPHCHAYDCNGDSKARERGSVYYPTTISSIYNATMNLLQRHLHNCPAVPDDIMRRYETLKADDARSGTSKRYWIESALSLGLVDTPNGIRHSALRPPPLPSLTTQQTATGKSAARRNSNEFFSTKSNATADMAGAPNSGARIPGEDPNNEISKSEREMAETAPLVTTEDKPYATTFSYHLLSQMQPCVFTEADRLGKRKGLPPGFPGLACRHCFGGYGSGRFFPSSIKTLSDTSKTLNVLHNHMMRCRKCPADVKESLEKLRGSHDEERAKMKFGSQKAFFARIWERLHGKDHPGSHKRSLASLAPRQGQQQQAQQHQRMIHQQMQQQQGYQQHSHEQQRAPTNGLEALAAASSPSKRQKI